MSPPVLNALLVVTQTDDDETPHSFKNAAFGPHCELNPVLRRNCEHSNVVLVGSLVRISVSRLTNFADICMISLSIFLKDVDTII